MTRKKSKLKNAPKKSPASRGAEGARQVAKKKDRRGRKDARARSLKTSRSQPQKRKKRTGAGALRLKKVPAVVWTAEMPLGDGQHERFVQILAKGIYSQTSAYLQAYGENPTAESARSSAARLLANDNVRVRLEHLKREGAKRAEVEVGYVIRLCLNIIDTPVGYVDEESPLAQEVTRDITGSEEEGVVTKVKVKMPSKMDAAKLLTDIKGWKKAQELDVNVNYTRPEEAAQKALAAGVDVKALLSKLLGGGSQGTGEEVKRGRGEPRRS